MSLNRREMYDLMDLMFTDSFSAVIACEDEEHASNTLVKLQQLGYNVVLQSSAFCAYEVVITGVGNGNAGPSWNSSRQSETSS